MFKNKFLAIFSIVLLVLLILLLLIKINIVTEPFFEANNYPNDADCSWEIRVGDGKVVQLTFVEFELENK